MRHEPDSSVWYCGAGTPASEVIVLNFLPKTKWKKLLIACQLPVENLYDLLSFTLSQQLNVMGPI